MTTKGSKDEDKIKSINEALREKDVLNLRERVRIIEEEMEKLNTILKELTKIVDDVIEEKLEP